MILNRLLSFAVLTRCSLIRTVLLILVSCLSAPAQPTLSAIEQWQQATGITALGPLETALNEQLRQPDARLQQLVLQKLADSDEIYQNRLYAEVVRLRGFLLNSLATTGVPKSAEALVMGEIIHGHEPIVLAGAIKAWGTTDNRSQAVLNAFDRFLDPNFHDASVDPGGLTTHEAQRLTTVRLETLRALQKKSMMSPTIAARLAVIAQVDGTNAFSQKTQLVQLAADLLHQPSPATSLSSRGPACCSRPEEPLINLPSGQVLPRLSGRIRVIETGNRPFPLRQLNSRKPLLVTFFYSRCPNPNKCSRTISHLAGLQALLDSQTVNRDYELAIVTLDSDFDTYQTMRNYVAERGVRLTESVHLLRFADARQQTMFLQTYNVPVSFNAGVVTSHNVQMLLFDRHQRVAREYRSILWEHTDVLAELNQL